MASLDFSERPLVAIWEVTQACDLVCVHCRACAQPFRSPLELTTAEGRRLIDEIAAMRVPVFVLTGGDPLKRPDIYELIGYARGRGVHTALSPSATPLLTREAIRNMKDCGLMRLALSLDGSREAIHDAFRGVRGSYQRTLEAAYWADEVGQSLQINTTVTRRNLTDFERIAALVEGLDVALWSVFFLVPTGRGQLADLPSGEEFEEVFRKLYQTSCRVRFAIKTTEAPHYRRYVAQRRAVEQGSGSTRDSSVQTAGPAHRLPPTPRRVGVNDGKGFVFISYQGDVYPSGFLPMAAGNVRKQSLVEIYRNSALFVALRDPSKLKGKCGVCEFREICGGSRARAFALTGDPLAEEPCCIYQPGPLPARSSCTGPGSEGR